MCIALSALVDCQGLQTIPSKLYVKRGSDNVNLLCKSDKPIESCSVKVPGFLEMYDVHTLPYGLGYYGTSLPKGECGVTIQKIKVSNEGFFQCNVTVGGQVFQESIEIVLAVSPEPTEIELGEGTAIEDGGLSPNQTLVVRCISQDAVPQSNLSWYLDDEPLSGGSIGPLSLSSSTDKKGKKLFTVEQELRYFITPKDSGKRIVCRAEHFAISKGFYRAFLPLTIRFPPEPVPTVYIGNGPHTMVNITIRANPRPTTSWRIKALTVSEGESEGPYQAYIPKDMGNSDYLVLLKVNEQASQTELFELTASNELGAHTYVIKASQYPADSDDKSAGSGAVFWLISIWTFISSVILSCLLSNVSLWE